MHDVVIGLDRNKIELTDDEERFGVILSLGSLLLNHMEKHKGERRYKFEVSISEKDGKVC